MFGLMQDRPLLISTLLTHAVNYHGERDIVSQLPDGTQHRSCWREIGARAQQLANAMAALGVGDATRVGTLAWNTHRHLELYFGVPGMGAVLHTVNPRLHLDQIAYIVDHAGDEVLCFDLSFTDLVKSLAPRCPKVRHWVALCHANQRPVIDGIEVLDYESLLATAAPGFHWPSLDERQASSLCYTSGTTGNPKGVLYSHRSTVLHTMASALPDALNISARDVVLPVVPMFHVNAWGLPYSACLVGAKLVFPGPGLDGKSLHELFEAEGVTVSAGVPTVWQGLLAHVSGNGLSFSTMRRTVIGGSACPPAMINAFNDTYGVEVLHAWGMTEMSPLGTVCTLKNAQTVLPPEEQLKVRLKQGRAVYGVDMKIVDESGNELPWDGKAYGDLLVRGPWIIASYFKGEGGDPLRYDANGKGWFPTGDVATIDADGFMQITDRSKDVIKSGGEWISSIDVENIAMAHPAVAMAACVGMKHPKWDERPIVVVMKKPGAEVTREELLAFYEGKIAKWQVPDDVVFVDAIPLGATGKMQKMTLRQQLKDYVLPGL